MLAENSTFSTPSCSSHPCLCSPRSVDGGLLSSILNMSPRLFSHSKSIVELQRTSADRSSHCGDSVNAADYGSSRSVSTDDTPTSKSSAELRSEIATLEAEIIYLERYLLSLYRAVFQDHLLTLPDIPRTHLQDLSGPTSQSLSNQSHCKMEHRMKSVSLIHQNKVTNGWASLDNRDHAGVKVMPKREPRTSGHCSLADLLGASCIDNTLSVPHKLSEDIVKCITSIYCKLTSPLRSSSDSSASPASSMSSSLFSSQNYFDSWSPHCKGTATLKYQWLKEENGSYAAIVEVLNICLDDDSFNYATEMLQHFRSLVRSLEKVDLGKMTREEKLSFWINIHNALVMHAYLAYGTSTSIKGTSILKWLHSIFSSGRRHKSGNGKHVYALEYPEPLVHFALCVGAYSDPVIRVYTARNIFQELRLAKEEFIQANVFINVEQKILLPKILQYFAKDMSLSVTGLLDVINECLSEAQVKAIKRCMQERIDKKICWLPQSSSFRYIIHGCLIKEIATNLPHLCNYGKK